jgi:antitoxin component of RelBE/YafQ-DinJ toxin-antitoxin module
MLLIAGFVFQYSTISGSGSILEPENEPCAESKIWHNCGMTVIFRSRVDPRKLKKAEKVAEKLGTSIPELFRIFIAEVARTRSVPVSMTATDGLLLNKERRNRIWASLDDTKTW